jgi:Repulsive guidance molecule (RGM) C-terminus
MTSKDNATWSWSMPLTLPMAWDLTFTLEPRFVMDSRLLVGYVHTGRAQAVDCHHLIDSYTGCSFPLTESAALRIGDDTLEVSSWGFYAMNGVESADLSQAFLGPFAVKYTVENKKKSIFSVHDGDGDHIVVSTYKDWVNIKIFPTELDYQTSQGLLGEFPSGVMLARNGTTVFTKEEANEFGNEWQVTADEPMLFMLEDREPQLRNGQKCIMPSTTASAEQRRLGEAISEEAAKEACAHHVEADQFENCVYDVMASGDLDMAMAGAF